MHDTHFARVCSSHIPAHLYLSFSQAQVSQLKARVAELLADLAERDDALARDRARWAALRGDPAALAGMSLTELQVLVRGQVSGYPLGPGRGRVCAACSTLLC